MAHKIDHTALRFLSTMEVMKAQIQKEVLSILEQMPDEVNWLDFKRALQTFERIDQGVSDLSNQRVWSTEKLRNHFRKKTFS
jgi:hypothetical protein